MILDGLLEFDTYTGVAITVTRDSTNILDLKNQRDLGAGDGVLDLLVLVQTAFTAGGAATLTVDLQGAPDNGGVPGAFASMGIVTPAIPVASLIAGAQLLKTPLPLMPLGFAVPPRFLKLVYTVATGPMLTGKIAASIIGHNSRDANYPYPSGIPAQTYA